MFSDFMVNTWIAASLVAVVAGCIGFFVVVRGATFAAHALPLSAFPGAAAATLLGVNQFAGLVVFAALGVAGISELARRERHEVATALCLVALLGLGTLFLSLTSEYAQSVYALLFGDVLGISEAELPPLALMAVVCIAAILLLFRPLLLSAVSPDLAASGGIATRLTEIAFLGILALATAIALPLVGALLVFSLMVGPASAARALSARPAVAMVLSAVIALVTVWAAVALSYLTNWPIGFFVGGLASLCYIGGRLLK
ncbi:metal ABC transporter permease [Acidocella sp.]|jgi:zinc/manganese transport system permease protein|uniref:metal ABC transporter permease n=1 Tax=Acidocella sp. TaxID=50710 RepID=UPI002F421D42